MRNLSLFIFCIGYSIHFFGQDTTPIPIDQVEIRTTYNDYQIAEFLQRKFNLKLDTYCEGIEGTNSVQLFGNSFFQKRFKEIFSTVVIGNSNVVSNGSAFAYIKDKDNSTFSINGTFVRYNWLLDIGAAVKNQTTNYNFYSSEAWSSDVTGSLGISRKIHGSLFSNFDGDYLSPCENLKEKRQAFCDTIAAKYQKVVNFQYIDSDFLQASDKSDDELLTKYNAVCGRITQLIALKRAENKIKLPVGTEASGTKQTTAHVINSKKVTKKSNVESDIEISNQSTINGLTKTEKSSLNEKTHVDINSKTLTATGTVETTEQIAPVKRDYQKEINELIGIRSTLIELLTLRDKSARDNERVDNFVEEQLGKFDEKNDYASGYSIGWVSLKSSFTNQSIKLVNESIINDEILKKISNLFKMSLELSYNYTKSNYHILFLKAYTKVNRSSFIDVQNLKDGGFNVAPVIDNLTLETTNYTINNDQNEFVNLYSELKHPVLNMDIGGYLGWLPFFKKTLGLNASVNFNFPVEVKEVEYKPNYSVLAGLFLRVVSESKWTAATFTINGGFENNYHDVNAWDNFVLKAAVGVPFSIFEKAKPEAK